MPTARPLSWQKVLNHDRGRQTEQPSAPETFSDEHGVCFSLTGNRFFITMKRVLIYNYTDYANQRAYFKLITLPGLHTCPAWTQEPQCQSNPLLYKSEEILHRLDTNKLSQPKPLRFVPLRLPASVWFTVSGILFLEQRERWQICSSQHYLYGGKEKQREKCYTAHPPVIYKTNTEARKQPDTTHYHQDSSLLLTLCHQKRLHVFLQLLESYYIFY